MLRNSTMMTLSIKARTEIGYSMNSMAGFEAKLYLCRPTMRHFRVKQGRNARHEFVLEALSPLSARTNPMFGCLAVFVGERLC